MSVSIRPLASAGQTAALAAQPSSTAFASVTGPGAGAALGTIVAPPAGTYRADVYVSFSGTVTAAELNNVKLLANGATVAIITAGPVASPGGPPSPFTVYFAANGSNNVVVQAVAAAGAAAVYSVTLVLTRVA